VRVKTSITHPKDLLDWLARDRKDVEIIDRNAERLNREAMDTLEYSNYFDPPGLGAN
jgi:hypothetical protein